jgi:hypothetical protein
MDAATHCQTHLFILGDGRGKGGREGWGMPYMTHGWGGGGGLHSFLD